MTGQNLLILESRKVSILVLMDVCLDVVGIGSLTYLEIVSILVLMDVCLDDQYLDVDEIEQIEFQSLF